MKQQQIKQLSTELKIEDVDKESFIKALDVISKDEKEMKKKYLQYQDLDISSPISFYYHLNSTNKILQNIIQLIEKG